MSNPSPVDLNSFDKRIWNDELVLDEKSNAIDFLEKAVRFLLEFDKDRWALKWIAIAIHGSLYGFGVCAVHGVSSKTNDYIVVDRTKKGARKLKSFPEIMKMCQNEQIAHQYIFSKHLQLTDEQRRAIKWLSENVRNQVEHYIPCFYAVGMNGIPQALASCFEVIEFLAIESGNILLEENEHAWVKSLCDAGKSLALNLKINRDRSAKHTKKPYLQLERTMPGIIQQKNPDVKSRI